MRPLDSCSTIAPKRFIHSCCESLSVAVPSFITLTCPNTASGKPNKAAAIHRLAYFTVSSLLSAFFSELRLLHQRVGCACFGRQPPYLSEVALACDQHRRVSFS